MKNFNKFENMKPTSCIFLLAVIALLIIFTVGCKKDKEPSLPKNTMTDIDGNVYNTVTIDTQVWMAENLKVTRYRNGDSIANVTEEIQWRNFQNGAYCYYNNIQNNDVIYGKLYNWLAVKDSRIIAPIGWHIPTDVEWTTLTNYLGESVAGIKLKEAGLIHWQSPNTGATNETGFNALPGGYRSDDGSFHYFGAEGYWWSSTERTMLTAWFRYILNDYNGVSRGSGLDGGLSIRCVKD